MNRAAALACVLFLFPCLAADQDPPTYVWQAANRQTAVTFACTAAGLAVHVADPQRQAAGHTYPVTITTAVSYSPALGAARDLRRTYHGTFNGDRAAIADGPRFLHNLQALHRQELDNRAMLAAQYDRAVWRCNDMPDDTARNRCFGAFTPAAYFTDPYPSLTVNVTHHTNHGPLEDPHTARTLPAFNSQELLDNIERLPCIPPPAP